ncbi:hypothetical protein [Roseomonas rosulenta]|uniref:hypothetical protein n=1 Tax=Roseomonas rosulenta TaxID=2748667 RepID=UPI0018DF2FA7|nr:hypothetical protein [Roseomonas rosulenta]
MSVYGGLAASRALMIRQNLAAAKRTDGEGGGAIRRPSRLAMPGSGDTHHARRVELRLTDRWRRYRSEPTIAR